MKKVITHPASKLLKPLKAHQQGDVDSLCGIYALLNSVRYLKQVKGWKVQARLMKKILDHMEAKGMTATTVRLTYEGTLLNEMASALKYVVCPKYQIKRAKPYHKNPETTINHFLRHCQGFLEQKTEPIIELKGEQKKKYKAIILTAIGGKHDHWTLIYKITQNRILLYDSSKLTYLSKKYCCLPTDEIQTTHIIYPTHTYFLWVE